MLPANRWALRLARHRIARRQTRTVISSRTPASRGSLRKLPPPSSRHVRSGVGNGSGQPARPSGGQGKPQNPNQSQSQSQGQQPQPSPTSRTEATANALWQASQSGNNNLAAPVHVPSDPSGILSSKHPATALLSNSTIVIQRQLEMMNVFLGFEQANKYIIMDAEGNHIGFLAEQDHGFGNAIARQAFRTHRSFTAHVFDSSGQEVLRFHRPFSWISSKIRVYDAVKPGSWEHVQPRPAGPDGQHTAVTLTTEQATMVPSSLQLSEMRILGEAQQQWAPLRRKYNLFLHREPSEHALDSHAPQLVSGEIPLSSSTSLQASPPADDGRQASMMQFAAVDEPFLSWDFSLKTQDEQLVGSVNRNFSGFAREIFTDTGVYALRMDSVGIAAEPRNQITTSSGHELVRAETPGMTLDQRAVMLATAVSIDFDYFSRHSGAGHGGFFPFLPMWMGGGTAAEAGAAGGAAEAGAAGAAGAGVGIAEGAAGAAVGTAARGAGVGAAESGIAGAGTIAGYEAMQRGRGTDADDASPQAPDTYGQSNDPYGGSQQDGQQGESFWGEQSPWDRGSTGEGPDQQGGGGGGSGGGEGGGGSFWDFFDDV